MVATLTLDLKDSRKYETNERSLIQSYLIVLTETFNLIFQNSLLRDLRFSGGDELQGLFSNPESAFLCLRLFHRMLFSIPFHAGIGIGEWNTVVKDKDTFYQDGSAFHRARTAIDLAKKDTEHTAIICSETEKDPVYNALLNCCLQLTNKNTEYQNELCLLLECCYPVIPTNNLVHSILEKLPLIMKKYCPNYIQSNVANDMLKENDKTKKQLSPLQKIHASVPILTFSSQSSDTLIFSNSHPFGAASKLAEITGLTRQSIDAALRKSDIYTERAVALALKSELYELNKKF